MIKKRIRKAVSMLLRLALGVALIACIFRRMDLPDFHAVLLACLGRWPWLAAGAGLAGVVLLMGAVRWKIILAARGLDYPWNHLLRVYLIGQFFNSFMLGVAGGDLVRAFYVGRATGCRKTEALATVLVDRVSGMFMVYLVALLMMAINAELFLSHWALHLPALMMLAMIAGGVAFLLAIYNVRRFQHWAVFNAVRRRPGLVRVLGNLLDVFDMFRRQPGLVLRTSLLSLLAQILLVCQCYCLGRSLEISLGFTDYLAVIPVILSLAAIPITPGGLGVREALSVTMLGAMGVPSARALPLSLMVYAVSVLWSIVGGAIFMGYSSGAGRARRAEAAELREEVAREAGEFGIAGAHEE